jgi:hypothetical protein
MPRPKRAQFSEEDPRLRRFAIEFEVSVDGEKTFTEKVYARDELTAVARAAWSTALKGYEVLAVRSVMEASR